MLPRRKTVSAEASVGQEQSGSVRRTRQGLVSMNGEGRGRTGLRSLSWGRAGISAPWTGHGYDGPESHFRIL